MKAYKSGIPRPNLAKLLPSEARRQLRAYILARMEEGWRDYDALQRPKYELADAFRDFENDDWANFSEVQDAYRDSFREFEYRNPTIWDVETQKYRRKRYGATSASSKS